MTNYINLNNARRKDQRKVMEDILKNNECPFCWENLKKYHKKPFHKTGKYWVLTDNQWPYDYTDPHLIAINLKHTEKLADLSKTAFAELLELFQWAEKKYAVKSGGIAMRFGDVMSNGATVNHLHAHFIVPAKNKPDDQKIKFKISN